MKSLVDIAKSEDIVLFDSSATGFGSFLEKIYCAERYANLDEGLLEERLRDARDFFEFLVQRNTFTVNEAIEDFEKLQRATSDKQRYLNQSSRENRLQTRRRRTKKQHENYEYAMEPGQKEKTFNQIADLIYQSLYALRHSIFVPDNQQRYNLFYTPLPYIWGTGDFKESLLEKHRKLYAAAFYLNSQQKPVALVVKGQNFMKGLAFLVDTLKRQDPRTFPNLDVDKYPIRLYVNDESGTIRFVYGTQNEKPA